MAKNRHFYGFFARFRAIFGVLQRTLTPSLRRFESYYPSQKQFLAEEEPDPPDNIRGVLQYGELYY